MITQIPQIPHMKTIDETAEMFKPYGISKHFIRQKVLNGEIVSVKAGCKYLVNINCFIEYLNGNAISTPAEQEESTEHATIRRIPVNL